jgi:hypothetical protein
VLESERAKERAVQKETAERLAAFRKLRDDADRGAAGGAAATAAEVAPPMVEGLDWAVSAGRKRKAGEKEGLRGVKVRRTVGKTGDNGGGADATAGSEAEKKGLSVSTKKSDVAISPKSKGMAGVKVVVRPVTPSLGLAGYSSDEDDED